VPLRLEQRVREVKHLGARQIFDELMSDLTAFGTPTDDLSLVVIKQA
jgi:hypothetical protein